MALQSPKSNSTTWLLDSSSHLSGLHTFSVLLFVPLICSVMMVPPALQMVEITPLRIWFTFLTIISATTYHFERHLQRILCSFWYFDAAFDIFSSAHLSTSVYIKTRLVLRSLYFNVSSTLISLGTARYREIQDVYHLG